MRLSPLILLALALPLAGCLGSPAPQEQSNALPPAEPPVAANNTTLPNATAPAVPLGPVTNKTQGSIDLSVATPVRTVNFNPLSGSDFSISFRPTPNVTGYVIEVAWNASTPLSQTLSLWVRPNNDSQAGAIPPDPNNLTAFLSPPQPPFKVDGPSPLRLAIAAKDLPPSPPYDALVRASSSTGAAVTQDFTIYVTTFDGIPFNANYSAVGGK